MPGPSIWFHQVCNFWQVTLISLVYSFRYFKGDPLEELRRALDRQTMVLARALDGVATTLNRSSSAVQPLDPAPPAGVLRAVLHGLGEVGVTRAEARRALEGVAMLENRCPSYFIHFSPGGSLANINAQHCMLRTA